MQNRAVALVVALFALACERPTAPEARDIARDVEQKLAAGNLGSLMAMLIFNPVSHLPFEPSRRNAVLEIVRDGMSETVNAFVVENVWVAPRGVPSIRRTLGAWPDDVPFAIVASTEQPIAHVSTDTAFSLSSSRDMLSPQAFVRLHHRDEARSWVPEAGTVAIDDPIIERECDLTTPKDVIGLSYPGPGRGVKCEIGLYQVRMTAEFVTQREKRNSLLANLATRRRLEIRPHRVPGIRFTTICPDPPPQDGSWTFECTGSGLPYHFWRDNRLFASSFGIDVAELSRFKAYGGPGAPLARMYRRDVRRGEDREPPRDNQMARWSIYTADGKLLQRDSTTRPMQQPATDNGWEGWLNVETLGRIRWNSRIQVIGPPGWFGLHGRSFYEMVVLDLEFGPR